MNQYVAWNGETYQGEPPAGWQLAGDGRWWPAESLAAATPPAPAGPPPAAPQPAPPQPVGPQPAPQNYAPAPGSPSVGGPGPAPRGAYGGPPPASSGGGGGAAKTILIVLGVLLVVLVGGCGAFLFTAGRAIDQVADEGAELIAEAQKAAEENAATIVPSSVPATATSQADRSTGSRVGQTVRAGGWELTVHQVIDPLPAESVLFDDLADGNRFVEIDAEVTNIDDESGFLSSFLCFGLHHNPANGRAEQSASSGSTGELLDGMVNQGEQLRGSIVYEVPQSWTSLQLRFDCTFQGDVALIDLN